MRRDMLDNTTQRNTYVHFSVQLWFRRLRYAPGKDLPTLHTGPAELTLHIFTRLH
jgi:hypothetical protein